MLFNLLHIPKAPVSVTGLRINWRDHHPLQLCFTCAVVSILVQLVAWCTPTAVPSGLVGAVVLTVAVVHSALIDVCKQEHSWRTAVWWVLCAQVLLAHAECWHKYHWWAPLVNKHTHTAGLLTKTSVPVSVEALVALAEIGANDVSTASIVVTPVATWRTLIVIWKEKKKKKKAAPKLSSFPFTKPLGIILLEGITAGIKTRAHKEADPVLTGGRQR